MTVDILALLNQRQLELGPDQGTPGKWRHWRLSRDANGLAWLIFDRQDSSVNAISEDVLLELEDVLNTLDDDLPKGLVIRSAKKSGFCVGADVNMFESMSDPGEVAGRLRWAHSVVDRLAALPIPTTAVIHGACLGGGLELALACERRIAVTGATLGFPEVLLGLHPGMGGTFRATALINPLDAMTLMLTGKSLDARRAKAMGLVDAVTEERHVANAVASAGAVQRKRPWYVKAFDLAWVRNLLARRMIAETEKKVSPAHYPAPFELIELWRVSGADTHAMQNGEIHSFAGLVTSAEGQNLLRIFALRDRLKGQKTGDSGIRHVHVVGAGTMGGDIAAWCALSGYRVTLADQQMNMIARAMARAAELARRQRLSGGDRRAMLDRLIPDPSGDGVAQADLVIEAVPENVGIKVEVYKQLEARMKPGAILASNTSSIPLELLSTATANPGRFVGLHFFNPVAKMQLVELVEHDRLDDRQRQRALAFIHGINRLPVLVKSAPGFLVNRVLTPYLLEAMLLLDEGVAAETIDQAALDFGMPVGPIELADQVGLDICIAVADTLAEQLEEDVPEVPEWIRRKVADGATGRKAGKGLYTWTDKGPVKKKDIKTPGAALEDRLILPLLNACAACLRDGVVTDVDMLDGAVVFGTGFAPFRGGPLHYAVQRGLGDVVASLERLEDEHGSRFTPNPGWRDLAKLTAYDPAQDEPSYVYSVSPQDRP
ncbi:MAG: 3-hydroxyacyl-CoA dehydrogenase NAD-binding domain-containing protein [Porticoccaceae bacterium]